MEKKEPSCTVFGNVNWNSHYEEQYGDSFKITKNETTIWPSNPTTGHQSIHSLSRVQLFEPHRLQYTRLPCPSLSPRVCSNSCPLSLWCHSTISSSAAPFSSCSQSFPELQSFSNEPALCIWWPKYWSFSISPSNEYSGLTSFKIDWFWFRCCLRASQESSPAPQFEDINSLSLSLIYGPILTSIHDS